MFTRMLRHALPAPERFGDLAGELFRAMATGGRVGFQTVAWFNGSLFQRRHHVAAGEERPRDRAGGIGPRLV